MIHKQIYNSSFFSTTGRISRGIFIERILLITVLFLLTYSILLHYAGENKSSFLLYNEHLIRYFLISLWMLFSLIQYIKRIHDCSRSFIQSLKNPFIIFTKGTYGSNKYGLLSDDIYYIKGVKDFNKDEFLDYQKKGNRRAFRSLFLLFSAIIMIFVFRMYNPPVTTPPVTIITQDSYIHSFSDTLVIDSTLPNKDTLIKRKVYDTTFILTIAKNGNNEVVNTKRTFSKLDSTETSEIKKIYILPTTRPTPPKPRPTPPKPGTYPRPPSIISEPYKTNTNGGANNGKKTKGRKINTNPEKPSFREKFN